MDEGEGLRQQLGQGDRARKRNEADVSEEFARKGQEPRDMTRDLDLLKVDIDVIATVIRMRGAPARPARSRRMLPTARPSATARSAVQAHAETAQRQFEDCGERMCMIVSFYTHP